MTNDELTKSVTAFLTFADLVAACRRGYTPTLYTSPKGGLKGKTCRALAAALKTAKVKYNEI